MYMQDMYAVPQVCRPVQLRKIVQLSRYDTDDCLKSVYSCREARGESLFTRYEFICKSEVPSRIANTIQRLPTSGMCLCL